VVVSKQVDSEASVVKKSGFLNKIVGRFRSGSVLVDDRNSSASERSKVATRAMPQQTIPGSKRKLSAKEKAQLTMTGNFQELSTLLRGVESHLDGNATKFDQLNENVSKLPAVAREQVEMLRALVSGFDKQNVMNGKMVDTLAELPAVMKGVQDSLHRAAVTDERTSSTLDEFRGTMDRIQGSMGEMVATSHEQADAAKVIAEDHRDGVQAVETVTRDGLEALRMAQEDQANRMAKIASEAGRGNRVVVVLLILSFAALVAIFAALVNLA
jgi:methyl-accepting chemotaxis protein